MSLHGIFTGAEEGLDTQMLFDPFEEEFDLPAAFVQLSDSQCGEHGIKYCVPRTHSNAPPIKDRLDTLDGLHRACIRTYAMIAPMLPGSEGLAEILKGKVDYVIVDRMNYNHADWVYRKYGLNNKLTDDFFYRKGLELASTFRKLGIECRVVC